MLREDITADWVIVGAGFAGVAFARRLAEINPCLKIIIVDAHSTRESASARNSGFVIGLPHNIGSSTAELKKPTLTVTCFRKAFVNWSRLFLSIIFSVTGNRLVNITARLSVATIAF